MATQGTPLVDVDTFTSIDGVDEIPMGDLLDVPGGDVWPPYFFSGIVYANRFPTPPAAFGFLIDIDAQMAFSTMPSTEYVNAFQAGVLAPEGSILEPTIGQIWPR